MDQYTIFHHIFISHTDSLIYTYTCNYPFSGCGHTITPLLCAIMLEKPRIIDLLLNAGASCKSLSYGTFWRASGSSVCSSCDVKLTPLHMSAYTGNLEITHALLQKGETEIPNQLVEQFPDNRYFTLISPLWLALLKGHEKIVKLFLCLQKPVTLANHFGSGLQVCLEEGHTNLALMLLRAGYDLSEDLEWIEDGNNFCKNEEVMEQILKLVNHPRSLMDCCASSLRDKFGLMLDHYLIKVGAPRKVYDILNFHDISNKSWQEELCLLN